MALGKPIEAMSLEEMGREAMDALERMGGEPAATIPLGRTNGPSAAAPPEPDYWSDAEFLPMINPASWDGQEAPAREWSVADWIPLRQTTLFTGNGGVGKSLIAQLLCTCSALGRTFMGVEVRQAGALYLSCEDDTAELWRRQAAICASLGVSLRDLDGKLWLTPLQGEPGNALATFDQVRRLEAGDRYRQLRASAIDREIGFFALDNATHLMAGDHSDLHEVAAFLGLLNGLALDRNGAVLLLHHTNKAGDDWLGSVAWENQVRSRMIMRPSDVDGDPDARSLHNPKANYSPMGGRLDFRWYQGSFVRDQDLPPNVVHEIAANAQATAENEIFLRCLALATEAQRAVSHNPGSNYAPKVFAAMPAGKGYSDRAFARAMERLISLRHIELDQPLWRGPNRVQKQGIKASESAPTPLHRPPAPTCTKPAETLHASTPLYTTYISGAAPGPAAPESEKLDLSRTRFPARAAPIIAPGEDPDDPDDPANQFGGGRQ